MKKEVKKGEYKILDFFDKNILYTRDLGSDISFTLHAPEFQKSCMARNVDEQQIKQILEEINIKQATESISLSFIGGDNSVTSQDYIKQLLKILIDCDKDTNILNIVSFDVGDKIHPESYGFDCYSGLFYTDLYGLDLENK
jgi:hypothetical protein